MKKGPESNLITENLSNVDVEKYESDVKIDHDKAREEGLARDKEEAAFEKNKRVFVDQDLIKEAKSSIEQIQKGDKFDSEETPSVKLDTEEKVETKPEKKKWFSWFKSPFGKRNATLAVGITAALAGKAQGPNVQNNIYKNINVQERKVVEKYTPFEQITNKETIGNITMEGYIFVPQKDTTKEFITVYASENASGEHSIGNLLVMMKSKGYLPADRRLLEKVSEENSNDPRFKKLMPWIMALTPEADGDDSRMNEKRIVSTAEQASLNRVVEQNKNFDVIEEIPVEINKIYSSIPSHAVFPTVNPVGSGRYELDQGVPFDKYGFLFYKAVDKTTANYSDLAKK